ncbi:hypothetical protein [Longivirga aurantiaca]|uniref:Uncharacterized protein n=1 Tax=Longivirga aurantiaca TaxID=1837743 RepID=A0ABW1T4I5_9ACTN
MHCSWCGAEATTYLLSDRDSHNSVDTACDAHAAEYAHIYRRAVPVHRDVVDLREPAVIDLTDGLPRAAEAAATDADPGSPA